MISFFRKRGKSSETPNHDNLPAKTRIDDVACDRKSEKRKNVEVKVKKSNERLNGCKHSSKAARKSKKKPEKVLRSIFPKNEKSKNDGIYTSVHNVLIPDKKEASSRQHSASLSVNRKHKDARRQNLLTLITDDKELFKCNEKQRQTLLRGKTDNKKGVSNSRNGKPYSTPLKTKHGVETASTFRNNALSLHCDEDASYTTGNDSFVTATEISPDLIDFCNAEMTSISTGVSNDKTSSDVSHDFEPLKLGLGQEGTKPLRKVDSTSDFAINREVCSIKNDTAGTCHDILESRNRAQQQSNQTVRDSEMRAPQSSVNANSQFNPDDSGQSSSDTKSSNHKPQFDLLDNEKEQHSITECTLGNTASLSNHQTSSVRRVTENEENQLTNGGMTKCSKSYHKKQTQSSAPSKLEIDCEGDKTQEIMLGKIQITQNRHLLDFLKGLNLPPNLEARKRLMTDTIENIARADSLCSKCISSATDLSSNQTICVCRSHVIHRLRNQELQVHEDSGLKETAMKPALEQGQTGETKPPTSYECNESKMGEISQDSKVKTTHCSEVVTERNVIQAGQGTPKEMDAQECLDTNSKQECSKTERSSEASSRSYSKLQNMIKEPEYSFASIKKSSLRESTPSVLSELNCSYLLDRSPQGNKECGTANLPAKTMQNESLISQNASSKLDVLRDHGEVGSGLKLPRVTSHDLASAAQPNTDYDESNIGKQSWSSGSDSSNLRTNYLSPSHQSESMSTSASESSRNKSSFIVVYPDRNVSYSPQDLIERALKMKSDCFPNELDRESQDTFLHGIRELCEEILEVKMQSLKSKALYDSSYLTNSDQSSRDSSGTTTSGSWKSQCSKNSNQTERSGTNSDEFSENSGDSKGNQDCDSHQTADTDQAKDKSEDVQSQSQNERTSKNSENLEDNKNHSSSQNRGSTNQKKSVSFQRLDFEGTGSESLTQKHPRNEVKREVKNKSDVNMLSHVNCGVRDEKITLTEPANLLQNSVEALSNITVGNKKTQPVSEVEINASKGKYTFGQEKRAKNDQQKEVGTDSSYDRWVTIRKGPNSRGTSLNEQKIITTCTPDIKEVQPDLKTESSSILSNEDVEKINSVNNDAVSALENIPSYDHWVTIRQCQLFQENSSHVSPSDVEKVNNSLELKPSERIETKLLRTKNDIEIDKEGQNGNGVKKKSSYDHWVAIRRDQDPFLNSSSERQCLCKSGDLTAIEKSTKNCKCNGKMFDSLEAQNLKCSPLKNGQYSTENASRQPTLNSQQETPSRGTIPIISDNHETFGDKLLQESMGLSVPINPTSQCTNNFKTDDVSSEKQEGNNDSTQPNKFGLDNNRSSLQESMTFSDSLSKLSALPVNDTLSKTSTQCKQITDVTISPEPRSGEGGKIPRVKTFNYVDNKIRWYVSDTPDENTDLELSAAKKGNFFGIQTMCRRDSKQSILSTTEGVLKIQAAEVQKQTVTVLFEEVLPVVTQQQSLQYKTNPMNCHPKSARLNDYGYYDVQNISKAITTKTRPQQFSQSPLKLQVFTFDPNRQGFLRKTENPRFSQPFSDPSDTKHESLKDISPQQFKEKFCQQLMNTSDWSSNQSSLTKTQNLGYSPELRASNEHSVNEPHNPEAYARNIRRLHLTDVCDNRNRKRKPGAYFSHKVESFNGMQSTWFTLHENPLDMRKETIVPNNKSTKIFDEDSYFPPISRVDSKLKLYNKPDSNDNVRIPANCTKSKRSIGSSACSQCGSCVEESVNESNDDSTFNSKDSDIIRFCKTLNLKTVESENNIELCNSDSSNLITRKSSDLAFQMPSNVNVFTQNSQDVCIACEVAKLNGDKETEAPTGICNTPEKKRKKRQDSKHTVHFEPKSTANQSEGSSVNPVQSCTSFVYCRSQSKDTPESNLKYVKSESSIPVLKVPETLEHADYCKKNSHSMNEDGSNQPQNWKKELPAMTVKYSFSCCPSLDQANEPKYAQREVTRKKEKENDDAKNLIVLPLTGCRANVFIEEPGLYQLQLKLPETEIKPITKTESSIKTTS